MGFNWWVASLWISTGLKYKKNIWELKSALDLLPKIDGWHAKS